MTVQEEAVSLYTVEGSTCAEKRRYRWASSR